MADLFLVRFPEKPVQVPYKGVISIGRSSDNDVVLKSSRVSRKHTTINWFEPQNVYVITDLGSLNGTFLNKNKLPANHPCLINNWDKIRIASAVFTIRMVSDPKEITEEFNKIRSRLQHEVTELINRNEFDSLINASGFAGALSHICPLELFQIIETGAKSGILSIKTDKGSGNYTISNGQVIAAQFEEKIGEEAVYEVLTQSRGTFSFNPHEVDIKIPQIKKPTTHLLMEGCRLIDEASRFDQGIQDFFE